MIDIIKVQEIIRKAASLFCNRDAVAQMKRKSDFDFVTFVDVAVQQLIECELKALYPEIGFIGEESDCLEVDLDKKVWVLDPVDGTTNLIHNYQGSAVSLALMNQREVILGFIYNPFADEMYFAEKDKGSYLNGKRIFVSEINKMKESLISVEASPEYKEDADEVFEVFKEIYKDCQGLRRCGSAALDMAYAACGRIEAYTEKHLKIWDYAAATLLIREAGGKVLDYQGNNLQMEFTGNVVAGNAVIPDILVENYLNSR